MSKIITLGEQKEQKKGIDKVVDIMKITIGPRGKNVSLSNGDTVNDGRRIAEDITLKDPIENKGATKVRNLVRKVSSDVGGGRTASAILYQSLTTVGMNLLNKGFNFNEIKKGMNLAVKDIHEQLDKMAQPVKGKLKQIATISTESEELGKVIAETMEKIGADGIVTVEQSNSFGITSEIAEGLEFNKGYISPYMVTNNERLEAEYSDMPVLIIDKKISNIAEIKPVIDGMIKKGDKNLLIIAEDISEDILRGFAFLKFNGMFNVLAIKTPGVGDLKKFTLEDLSALTGAVVSTDYTKEVKLGKIKKVISKKDSTVMLGGNVKDWITTLKTRRELTENIWEKDQYNERIAKLQNGIAIIKVGASSEDEVKYLKLKIEDGVNECKRALEEGVVVGGDVAFIHAIKSIKKDFPKETLQEEIQGYQIVFQAVSAPLRQIVINSENSPDVIINILVNSPSLTIGYDSLDNKVVEDMYKLGIIDAVKVTKTVLKYAVDEAILFLSLGGDISEELIETK